MEVFNFQIFAMAPQLKYYAVSIRVRTLCQLFWRMTPLLHSSWWYGTSQPGSYQNIGNTTRSILRQLGCTLVMPHMKRRVDAATLLALIQSPMTSWEWGKLSLLMWLSNTLLDNLLEVLLLPLVLKQIQQGNNCLFLRSQPVCPEYSMEHSCVL